MSTTRTFTCNLCEAMCGLRFTLDEGRITSVRGNPNDVFSRGHICPKGPALAEVYADPDRLRTPMRRTAKGFVPVPWDEALDEAAARLSAIRSEYGPDAVGYYYGNPVVHAHKSSLAVQLLTFALGTKNRFDPNSQDSAPKLFACMQMYGDGLAITVPDVDRTDLFLLMGANPAISGGSLMALGDVRGRLQGIRKRGGRMILLDPRRNETAAYCDEHHFFRPGGDAAFLLAILHVLFRDKLVNEDRVRALASGLDRLELAAREFSPERVAPVTGLPAQQIERLARLLVSVPRAVVYGRIGTSQNEFGPVCAWLLESVNVVTGNFDRAGGAMFADPVADFGAVARMLIGNVHGRWRSRVRGLPELLDSLPSAVIAEEMETPGPGQIRAFVCLAGNPVLSTPNGARLSRALAGLDFRLSIDIYLNETAQQADLVLPPTHALQTGNFDLLLMPTAVQNFLKASAPVMPKGPDERDDWEIATELALRMRLPRFLRGLGRRLLAGLPDRLVDLMLRKSGHTLASLHQKPDGIDLGPLREGRDRRVRTPDGRVRLAPEVFLDDLPRLSRFVAQGPGRGLVLIGRRDLRSDNSWMHNVPMLAKGPDRARLWMHPQDAGTRGLAEGSRVLIESRTGAIEAALRHTEEVMPGVVSLPHGFGHQAAAANLRVAGALPGPNVNAITDEERIEPILGVSALNGLPVEVRLANGAQMRRAGPGSGTLLRDD